MRALTIGVLAVGAVVLAGCGGGGGQISNTDPAVKKLVAELGPAYAGADVVAGRAKFEQCRACHTIAKDGPNMTGPNLQGVFGKVAGTNKPGYAYSAALKASGITWDAAAIDKWITSPRDDVHGTKMSFPGMPDPTDRRDVIAYVKVASSGGPN